MHMPVQQTNLPSPFASFTAEQVLRLVANLLRREEDGTRLVIGTYAPSPIQGDSEPLFHDLCLNLTVGDLRRWVPDHSREWPI